MITKAPTRRTYVTRTEPIHINGLSLVETIKELEYKLKKFPKGVFEVGVNDGGYSAVTNILYETPETEEEYQLRLNRYEKYLAEDRRIYEELKKQFGE